MRWFSVMASLDLGEAISARACCRYWAGTVGLNRCRAARSRGRISSSSQESRSPLPGAMSCPAKGRQPSGSAKRSSAMPSQSASEKATAGAAVTVVPPDGPDVILKCLCKSCFEVGDAGSGQLVRPHTPASSSTFSASLTRSLPDMSWGRRASRVAASDRFSSASDLRAAAIARDSDVDRTC